MPRSRFRSDSCLNIPISNNVGGVKHDLSTLRQALNKERHFALVDGSRLPTWARFESSGSGTQSDPAISSITNGDHDYLFELPQPRERDAQSLHR